MYMLHFWPIDWVSLSVQLFAHPGPLSMEFSRPEYWSRLPFPSLGDLPHPSIKPRQMLFTTELPGKPSSLLASQYICLCRSHIELSPPRVISCLGWPGAWPILVRNPMSRETPRSCHPTSDINSTWALASQQSSVLEDFYALKYSGSLGRKRRWRRRK